MKCGEKRDPKEGKLVGWQVLTIQAAALEFELECDLLIIVVSIR